jgi:hypothetical protein
VRAGFHLRERIGRHAREVASRHFGGEDLATGRIDALADDDERPVEADDDFPVAELMTVSVMKLPCCCRSVEFRILGASDARERGRSGRRIR